MKRTGWRWLALGLGMVATLGAQQTSGTPGTYSGPSVLSRWSRQSGSGARPGPILQGFLHGSYAYMDGLVGPVENTGGILGSVTGTTGRPIIPAAGSNTLVGGGGLTLNRTDARSSISLSYAANYAGTYASGAYRGLNQDGSLMYERQLSRRWGFFTGHSVASQSTILGLSRSTAQRNFFEPAYSPSNEALDARLRAISSGAGFYFQKSSKLSGSFDGGFTQVSRSSQALVGSRGERAQGELAYRYSRNRSVGVLYSFNHFFFPRGFGETYVHMVMATYTMRLGPNWHLLLGAGPYQADSERLRPVAVDPFIASLTGNANTVEVFKGSVRGLGLNASLAGTKRRQNWLISYRRGVDAGNGVTLSSASDNGQATYGYQTSRSLGMGVSFFVSRLRPLLTGAERNSEFRSYGGNFNVSYRLTDTLHVLGNIGLHQIAYDSLGVNQLRRVAMVGLAYSPGTLPLMR